MCINKPSEEIIFDRWSGRGVGVGAPTGCSPKGRKPVRAAAEACPKATELREDVDDSRKAGFFDDTEENL